MLGAIFALFYAAYLVVAQSLLPTEEVYLAATGFLYSWYFWWTIVLSVIVSVIALIVILIGGAVGADNSREPFGAIGGAILGGGVSLYILFVFAIRRGLFVGGAYLLNTALVTNPDGGYEWVTVRLVLGGLFLLIAFLSRSSRSSSSSSSSRRR